MLFTHRRRSLLTLGMAGMQLAWFTPFALLLLPSAAALPVLVPYGALFGVVLLWLVLLEAMNRRHINSPQYEAAVLGLVILSTLFFLRLLLYSAGRPAADLTWLGALVHTLFEFQPGAGQVIAIIILNVILWQRAASATSQEPSFFAIGYSFRLGMLLLILGSVLLEFLGGVDPVPLLWCYFGFGLLAVALARIEDKAYGADSQGTPLPRSRLSQLLLAIGVTVGLAVVVARFYTRAGILALIVWLDPVWRVLGVVVNALLIVLGWVVYPLMVVLEALLRRLINSGVLQSLRDVLSRLTGNQFRLAPDQATPGLALPAWAGAVARYGAVALFLLMLLGFVLLYLGHIRRSRLAEHAEDESAEDLTHGGGILSSALTRLRGLAALARRYGLNRQLLAAVSVQNIYANVSRLARLRGQPRRPAQPPDDYLPALCRAFEGQDGPLTRITAAYIRVHYGDRPVSTEELSALRADYHRLRNAGRSEVKP